MKTKIVTPMAELLLGWQKYGHHVEWKPVTAVLTADGPIAFTSDIDFLLVATKDGRLRQFKRRELKGAIPIGSTATGVRDEQIVKTV